MLRGNATAGDLDFGRGGGGGAESVAKTDTNTGSEASAMAAAASTTGLEPLESVAELSQARVCYTTVDIGADIMRKMEEVERIASFSRNLKGAFVMRLRLASRGAKASSVEVQQRTVATSAVASSMADLCRLRISDGAAGDEDARNENTKTEPVDTQALLSPLCGFCLK